PGRNSPGTEAAAASATKDLSTTPPATEVRPAATNLTDAKIARAEAHEALKRLDKPPEPEASATVATSKALREGLGERIRWLDEWDKVTEAQARFDGEPSPERQATGVKADLERLKVLLERATKEPASLLAGVFRNLSAPVTDAVRAEMKETLEAAKNEWNDW